MFPVRLTQTLSSSHELMLASGSGSLAASFATRSSQEDLLETTAPPKLCFKPLMIYIQILVFIIIKLKFKNFIQ